MSYVLLSALPIVPGSGCRAGGPPDRAAAAEREVEDGGGAVERVRLGGIVEGCVGWGEGVVWCFGGEGLWVRKRVVGVGDEEALSWENVLAIMR